MSKYLNGPKNLLMLLTDGITHRGRANSLYNCILGKFKDGAEDEAHWH